MILTTEQIEDVKELRQLTGEGLFFCKKALVQNNWDKAKALVELQKEMSRTDYFEPQSTSGLVASYVHMDKIGSMVVIGTQTDFCARTEVVKDFAHKLCVHVAANQSFDHITELTSPMFLLNQPWVYDETKNLEQIIADVSSRTGEKICIKKIARITL